MKLERQQTCCTSFHFTCFLLIVLCIYIKMLIHDFDWLRKAACLSVSTRPHTCITMGQLEIEIQYWNNVAKVRETDSKVYTNLHYCKPIASLKELGDNVFYSGDQVYNLSEWADETVGCAVRWNRVNRHFNVIALAGGNLWNKPWLECGFNQSTSRIRRTRCVIKQ